MVKRQPASTIYNSQDLWLLEHIVQVITAIWCLGMNQTCSLVLVAVVKDDHLCMPLR